MLLESKNIFENLDFNVFGKSIAEAIERAIETFWEEKVEIKLKAVNDFEEIRKEHLIRNIDFFSCQIRVHRHRPIIIRLSCDFIENFLDIVLSKNNQKFNLKGLSKLEIKILNTFSEFLYKKISEVITPEKGLKLTEASYNNINFLFSILTANNMVSEIMISIPMDRLTFKKIEKVVSFNDDDFRNCEATVRIKAGSSKITLDDLKSLVCDDIILLEESNSSKLTLLSGNLKKDFNVKVDPSMILNIDEETTNA